MIEFEMAGLPALQVAGSRGHWAVRYRSSKHWRQFSETSAKIKHNGRPPIDRALVTCTRFSDREPDRDNLVASFKPIIDGLVRAGVIVDDSPEHVTCMYQWQHAPRRRGKIRVRVETA